MVILFHIERELCCILNNIVLSSKIKCLKLVFPIFNSLIIMQFKKLLKHALKKRVM